MIDGSTTTLDGFGVRSVGVDAESGDQIELLELAPELVEHDAFVAALAERVARFASVRHTSYAHLRRLDRPQANRLQLVSDLISGWRLSELFAETQQAGVPVDINVFIGFMRQLLPAVALYARHNREAAIGTLSPERLIVTPQARLVIAEHAFGPPLEKLNLGRDKLWRDYRVLMPPTVGLPRANQRADAMGIGGIALSLLLGRALTLDEFPSALDSLVDSAQEYRNGQPAPLSPALSNWLKRALQLEAEKEFQSPSEAQLAFETVLISERSYVMTPQVLEGWVSAIGARIDAKKPQPEPELLAVEAVVEEADLLAEEPAEPNQDEHDLLAEHDEPAEEQDLLSEPETPVEDDLLAEPVAEVATEPEPQLEAQVEPEPEAVQYEHAEEAALAEEEPVAAAAVPVEDDPIAAAIAAYRRKAAEHASEPAPPLPATAYEDPAARVDEEPAAQYPEPVTDDAEASSVDQEPAAIDQEPAAIYEERVATHLEVERLNEQPVPIAIEPIPVEEESTTTYQEPAALYEEPSPVYEEKAQVYEEKAPVYEEKAPVYEEPAPLYKEPVPKYEPPQPQYVEPVPQYVAPAAKYAEPTPEYREPAFLKEEPTLQYAPAQSYEPAAYARSQPEYEQPEDEQPEDEQPKYEAPAEDDAAEPEELLAHNDELAQLDQPAQHGQPASDASSRFEEHAPEAYAPPSQASPEPVAVFAPQAAGSPELAPSVDATQAPNRTPMFVMAGVIVLLLIAVGYFATRGSGGSATAGDGEVAVTTRNAGANVKIDGKPVGVTPVTVSLPPGPHVVEVQLGNGEPRVVPVMIRSGIQTAQYVELPEPVQPQKVPPEKTKKR